MNRRFLIGMLFLAVAMPLSAGDELTPQDQARLAEALAPSLVRVQYTLQFDKGEAPKGGGWGEHCATCGQFHANNVSELVQEERPLETAGFLLAPTRVVAADPMVHPRFIKGIAVRFGERAVEARPAAYARTENALFFDLAEPLADAVPLAFVADSAAPYRAVTYHDTNGSWTIAVQSLSGQVTVADKDRRFSPAPTASLIVDAKGKPVAMSMNGELPIDGSWKASPEKWPTVTAAEVAKLVEALETSTLKGLPRVELRFRSPKAQAGGMGMYRRYRSSEEGEEATERNVLGLLLDERQILILAHLKKGATARLERILVHFPEGDPVSAKFARTLADYGAFVATLEKPAEKGTPFSALGLPEARRTLLLGADVTIQGDKRVAYLNRSRIPTLQRGRKSRLFPELPGDTQNLFLFEPAGALLSLPLTRREKVEDEHSRWRSAQVELIPAAYLKEALADKPENADAGNIPLTEEEESRIGWMGVELQAMNPELARANNVSEQTHNGETGALVSYVYPGSPAQQAGIEPGYILLRLHVQDAPKPADVRVEDSPFGRQPFPWDRYDQIPEQAYDRIPVPWTPVENTFNRMLTELGPGKKYKAEFFFDGKIVLKDFEVVISPTHFDTAPKIKSAALGITVRDLTFELRRYFQMEAADPGVVISKIETGSKGSVAGLKPFEIVQRVNDAPVANVKEFEKQVAGQGELRLSIKRMTRTRQVKIQLGGAEKEDKEKKEEEK